MGRTRRIILLLLFVVGGLLALVRFTLGAGERMEDRTTYPVLPPSALQVVADLPLPPGNLAVSKGGRIFFTFHPEASPAIHVAELVGGKPVPYPDEAFQKAEPPAPHFRTPLAVRIDRQDHLWVLDHGGYGITGQPRILAFDLKTNTLIDHYDFPSSIAGMLSMLNDFQVDPSGRHIYIADTSLFGGHPAIIAYDVENRTSRRLLDRHSSVMPKDYLMNAAGRDMTFFGLVTLKIGVDSIALDKQGKWLYYAPVSDSRMYRIAVHDLNDESLSSGALGEKVETWGRKTLSDGITMDLEDNVYISDMEHSAILQLRPDHNLVTLLKDERLRWPDGFSFGPDGWLYVSCSALHQVILRSSRAIHARAPYQIFRFKPGPAGVPGH
ncbi:MAG TPA: L-dopachrome tautomerase-related protein [Candidatus Binatia bacterium]|nr:L-dopachrome tautomerase-related protein [Candidatus Binatia bacterium]